MFSLFQFALLAAGGAILAHGAPSALEVRQAPSNKPVVGNWNYKGCYFDSSFHTLSFLYTVPTGNSAEACTSLCESEGYVLAGMEYGTECWCDNVMHRDMPMPEGDCNFICPGDSTEYCGAGYRMTIYESTLPPPPTPSNKPVIGTWNYKGCYLDASPRTLPFYKAVAGGVSAEGCIAACAADGYNLAGMEYGTECWCANSMYRDSPQPESGCNYVCAGDSLEYCGGISRLTVYENSVPVPVPSNKPTVGTWNYKGCYTDIGERTLTFVSVIPTANSVEECTAFCESEGYGLAGMEYGTECWCDNYMPRGTLKPDGECSTICPGDSLEYCGAGNRLTLYVNSAATPPSTSACIDWRGVYSFQNNILEAVPKTGGAATRLFRIPTNPVTDPTWYSIISTCPSGCPWTDYYNFGLVGGVLQPYNSRAIAPVVGSSQTFIDQVPATYVAYNQYCAKPSPISPDGGFIGKPLLSVDGFTDRWALCTNTTAAGREDIVYSPIPGHPHYDHTACTEVYIQIAPYA